AAGSGRADIATVSNAGRSSAGGDARAPSGRRVIHAQGAGVPVGEGSIVTAARSATATRRRGAEGVWRNYGLSLTLAVMFMAAWALQTWTGWVEFVSEQAGRGQPAQAFGPDGYIWSWAQSTFENW